MADKASQANAKIYKTFTVATENNNLDVSRILLAQDPSSINEDIKTYADYIDKVENSSSGNNTFTAGDKDSPIGESSTSTDSDTAQSLSETKAAEEKKQAAEDVANITDSNNAKDKEEIDNVTSPNLFLYSRGGKEYSELNGASNSIDKSGATSGTLGDNSPSAITGILDGNPDKGGICVDTTEKPSLFAKVSNKCCSVASSVRDKFSSAIKSGTGVNSSLTGSAIGSGSGSSLLKDVQNFNFNKTVNKYTNSVLTGDNALASAYSTATSLKKTATDKLKQLNAFQNQISSIVNNIRDACNINNTSSSSGIDLASLLGGDGWNTSLSNPASENAILDALDFFADTNVLKSFKDLCDKWGNPFSANELKAMLCRVTTGNISASSVSDYLTNKVKSNDVVSKVSYANDALKLAIKTDDPTVITTNDSTTSATTVIKAASQETIELSTTNCATRGAPRALDQLIDTYGKYKVKNYRHKIIQAHINDENYDEALFETHKEKYKINMTAYKAGKYGTFTGTTNSAFLAEYNVSDLDVVDLVQLKNDVVLASSSTASITESSLSDEELLFVTMPVA